jgi:PAS domain S-box-containing protein
MATILILDDRAINRNIYARLAAAIEEGVSVEVFADAADALEWLEHNRVDLVITDYKMPGMDGTEFTRRLRALPSGGPIPVLVVTAHDDRGFRVRALDAGATDFLQSPIDHFEFVTRARNLLALGRQAVESGEPLPGGGGGGGGGAAQPAAEPDALARILNTVPALITAADREGRCIYANAAFAAARGVLPAELVGRPVAELLGERNRQRDLEVFASGQPLPAFREEIAGQDGTPRPVLTRKTPLRDATGQVAAVLTTSFESAAWLPEPAPAQPGPE